MRLDLCLVENGIITSRERAKEAIKNGFVTVNETIVTKPSECISANDDVVYTGNGEKYVGRGGYKLECAIDTWNIDLSGKVCLDIGASTGGFTDCMLQHNAKFVYAVDVGTGQLSSKLLTDNRVKNMQQTDIRNTTIADFSQTIDFITADLSFISLKHIFPKIRELFPQNKNAVVLVKPQFESGQKNICKGGIVKDLKVHEKVLDDVKSYCIENNLTVKDIIKSPIKGGDGNTEYLMLIES